MKILYIAAEHVSGTLSLLQQEHRRRGDECRYITFYPSRWKFADDICLNLPFMPDQSWVVKLRKSLSPEFDAANLPASAAPPYWRPSWPVKTLFHLRDSINWPRIEKTIGAFGLDDFDIITLDGGLDFTRNCRFARHCKQRGGHIAAFYHGTDLRNRGIIPAADELIELRLTSEWDLLELDPRLQYLYLAFDTAKLSCKPVKYGKPIRIAHAARNRFKGTDTVIAAVEHLKSRYSLELLLFRDQPHDEVISQLQSCDLVIDQLTNAGGWGYGMLSVESLSMGLPVITNIPPQMRAKLDDHPFLQADSDSIESVLATVLDNEPLARAHAERGVEWVRKHHDVRAVGDRLYEYYANAGWLTRSS